MHTHTKYTPYPTVRLDKREWADKSVTVAYFKALVEFGFKEIEVAYPSASQTEFDFCRRLIEDGLVTDDVTAKILIQSVNFLYKSFGSIGELQDEIYQNSETELSIVKSAS